MLWVRQALAVVALVGPALGLPSGSALAASPIGFWFTEDHGGVVQVRACGDRLCGYIEGLSAVPDRTQQKNFRGVSQCHLQLLSDLKPGDDGRWHGTVTNPEDGRSYDADVWVPADGVLRLRGYVGIALFGSTQRWPPFTGHIGEHCRFP